jgi:hypothetical protein
MTMSKRIFHFNIWLLIKRVTPTYTKAFQSEEANLYESGNGKTLFISSQ